MSTEILVAIIGGIATILAGLISNLPSILRPAKTGKPIKEYIMIGVSLGVGLAIMAIAWSLSDTLPVEKKTFVGFYKDRNSQKQAYFATDKLVVRMYKDGTIRGNDTCMSEEQDRTMREHHYRIQGYYTNDYLMVTYLGEGNNPRSIGTYFLEKADAFYIGYVVMRDEGGIYMSPYVAREGQQVSQEEWQRQFPKLLSQGLSDVRCNPDSALHQQTQEP